MKLCPPCQEELTKWLDFRGRASLGMQIQVIGNSNGNIPSWVYTSSVVRKQVKSIRDTCGTKHRSEP